ncbi:MAG: hypothetical protein ACREEM_15700 [Blastocatellia bacterium]
MFQRAGEFVARQLSQTLNPGLQNLFLFASLLDPLAACVRDAVGRLFEEQRFFGFVAINQLDEREDSSTQRVKGSKEQRKKKQF